MHPPTASGDATTLSGAACRVLQTADPGAKARAARGLAATWRQGGLRRRGTTRPPDRPARPDRPKLRPPREMPRRRAGGSQAGRIALFHALAHIELNAIDLACDIVARFACADGPAPPDAFVDDWLAVADDEARHFTMLCDRLAELGGAYGDLPAHDGLWQAATDTADDLLARLAVVPMVLEARGLDVTPGMVARLAGHGDNAGAAILRQIHDDEIGHVAAGVRWFRWLCDQRGLDPAPTFGRLVRQRFRGRPRGPFNHASRAAAGMAPAFLEALAREPPYSEEPEVTNCSR